MTQAALTTAAACAALVATCAALAACGSSLRAVPTGAHADASLITVQTAPPPAKVETVPKDPGEPCAWLDGQWAWRGRTWEWTPGAWVVPPDGCYFAPPVALWAPTANTGVLFYRPGRWYRGEPGPACRRPRKCLVEGTAPSE